MMDCQTCQPLLPEYALDQLAEDEWDQVARHLEGGCPSCRQALRELQETWVALADALPPAEVPPHVQSEVRNRIAQNRDRSPAAIGDSQRRFVSFTPARDEVAVAGRRRLSGRWIAVAASLFVALTVGLVSWLAYNHYQWEAQRREVARLRSELARANELFDAGRLHFASLREAGAQSAVRGYVVWNRLSRQVHFYAFDLPLPAEGRVWRIWLLRDGQDPLAVGILDPQANRTGSAVVDVPDESGDQFRLAVVDGPSDPPAAPAREPWLTTDVE